MNTVFKRQLTIRLRSSSLAREMTFRGDPERLAIFVEGDKYLYGKQDMFTVEIKNIPYDKVLEILSGAYVEILISAGYESVALNALFKGQVIQVSHVYEDRTTQKVTFFCVNNFSGLFGSKLSISMKSGINMYAALDYLIRKGGCTDFTIDESLKEKILQGDFSSEGTLRTLIQELCDTVGANVSSGENDGESIISVWGSGRSGMKVYLTPENGGIINGRPTLSTNGLSLTSLPVMHLKCGDIVVIDNAWLNYDVGSSVETAIKSNVGFYANADGEYVITSLHYSLSTNADAAFRIGVNAVSKSLISSLTSST